MNFFSRGLFVCLLIVRVALLAQDNSASSRSNGSEQETLPVQKELVVVTGTFTPVSEPELDRSIHVIDTNGHEPLYRSWVDYLELDSSIDLRQRAPADVQGDLSIRGSTFGQTLVLLNGLRMDDVQTGHHDMEDLAIAA